MKILKLEVENWKCFASKRTFKFKNHELINLPNGRGKSSIFQAIQYAIYGKPPVGFNLNDVRNDDTKPCRVYIELELMMIDGLHECTVERIFGCSKPVCELRLDGNLICESIRTIEDWFNKLMNYKIVQQLWTNNLIQSDILRDDFFTKSILEDILSDPLQLLSYYKSKAYSHNRSINSFKEEVLDIKALEKEIEDLQSKLKKKVEGNVALAKSTEEAAKLVESLKVEVSKLEACGITLDIAKQWVKLGGNNPNTREKLEKQLAEEESKCDSIFSKFRQNDIQKMINESKSNGYCILCGHEVDENHLKELENQLKLSGRSEETITKLKTQLEILNHNGEDVKKILSFYEAKTSVEKCPNYQDILNEYDENNMKLWDKFNQVQKDYNKALRQQEELKKINIMKEELEHYRNSISILENYIEKASNYYTSQLMEKATQYLNSINSRYQQICLYEGRFHVIVEQEDLALNLLPVVRLSDGEKTICALSLLFAVHNMMVPDLPLLFDESFKSLDMENMEQIQNFLRKQNTQIFVITHNRDWKEF